MVDLPASLAQLQPYIGTAAGYGLSIGAGLGFAIIEFLVAIVIAAILLVTGEAGVQVLRRFVARIGGEHHLSLLDVAAQTIRGVAAGIIFTAFLQALLLVLGLVVVGAPGPILLGFLTFFLLVLQLPNWLVWMPVVVWLGYRGETGLADLPVHLGHVRRQHDRQFHPPLPDQPGRAAAVAADLRRASSAACSPTASSACSSAPRCWASATRSSAAGWTRSRRRRRRRSEPPGLVRGCRAC